MSDLELLLSGWRLTSAQIFYRMPGHPELVNPHWFLWQSLDHAPRFPRLNAYLQWWNTNLDGRLHTVRVTVRGLIEPTELRHVGGEFRLQ